MVKLPRPLFVLGDLNDRNPLWENISVSPRGNQLLAILEDLKFGILNTNQLTHFYSQNASLSCLDVSMCYSDAQVDFWWEVVNELNVSNYFQLFLALARVEYPPPML